MTYNGLSRKRLRGIARVVPQEAKLRQDAAIDVANTNQSLRARWMARKVAFV